jgi:hypothetical protein
MADPGPRTPSGSGAQWAGLIAALFAVAVVRRLGWESWSLWLDEAMQVGYALEGLRGLLASAILDGNHPPLDLLVTWAVSHLSLSDTALRLPPLLFGVGTGAALFVRCGGFPRFRPALGAVVAFAALPLAIHLGQEVRPYSLALFLLATADAARHTYVRAGSRRALALSVVAGAALAWTLYFGLLALAAIWATEAVEAYGTRRERPGRLRAAWAVPLLVLVLFSPWLAAMTRHPWRPIEMPSPGLWLQPLLDQVAGLASGFEGRHDRPAAALGVWLLAAAGIWSASREEKLRTGVDLLTSTAGVLVILVAANHWWGLRYLSMALLPLARAVGAGLAAFPGPIRRRSQAAWPAWMAWSTLATLFLAVEAPGIRDDVLHARPDWKRPISYLAFQRGEGRGGAILSADPWSYLSLRIQALRLRPPMEVVLLGDSRDLPAAAAARGAGWIARTPHHPAPAEVDGYLGRCRPWAEFDSAERARLYRFEGGALCPP